MYISVFIISIIKTFKESVSVSVRRIFMIRWKYFWVFVSLYTSYTPIIYNICFYSISKYCKMFFKICAVAPKINWNVYHAHFT